MTNIIIASKNPVKISAASEGFKIMFPGETFNFVGVNIDSGVSNQPFSDHETLEGALNRATSAKIQFPEGDFWVGIEGGVDESNGEMMAFAWVVVLSNGMIGKARTGAFFLPRPVVHLIRQGKELGEADDIVFNRYNSKQQNGAIGILTGDIINRQSFYEPAVIMALIPLKNPEIYMPGEGD